MQDFSTIVGIIQMRNKGLSFLACETRYHIGSGTAQSIMRKYWKSGRSLDELLKMTPAEVENLFYPPVQRKRKQIPDPPFDELFKSLENENRKTLKEDIWDLYHKRYPQGYKHSQFYVYLNRYLYERFGPDDLAMGVNRIPGERIFIDYCGDNAYVHIIDASKDPNDYSEKQKVHLYLTTCGFSSKIYCEASLDEKQMQFNSATANALNYYGAVPLYLVPDNLRAAVTKHTKDEVIINSSFQDLESFYDVIVLPPPYFRPRGKASCERYVKVIQRKINAELERQCVFQDLAEVNEVVRRITEEENNKVPRGYKHTHNELFEMYDKPAMKPLKDGVFLNCEYGYCPSVPNNYHVAFDEHFYSVPYRYYKSEVIVKATREKIILCDINNRLITEHKRCYIPTVRYITKDEHMPANHRFYSEINQRDSQFYLQWAEEIGTNMKQLICRVLKSANHDEQMYMSCNGIVHMCDGVPKGICEEAAADCVNRRKCTHSEFRTALSDLLSQRKQITITASLPDTENVWGKDYYS